MKKRLIVSLLVMFVMLFNIVSVCFAANENVTLTASKTDVQSGDTFEVIIAQESEGLTGFESTLSYDENVFSVSKRELGEGWSELGKDKKLDAMANNAVSSGNVFKLTFSVKDNVEPVTTEIKLTGIKAYRTSTDSVTIADKAVSVKVNGGTPVEPTLTGITLSNSSLNLVLGITTKMNLIAYPTPTDATLPEIVWKSSNESVAKLEKMNSNGNISIVPVAEGKTTITATTADGKYSAKCEVSVKANGNVSGENNNTTNNTTNTNNVVSNTNVNNTANKTNTSTSVKNTTANKTNTTNKTNVTTVNSTNSTDNTTTSSSTLPKTGSTTKYIWLVVAGLVGISVVSYVGYRKYKEI